MAHAGPLPGRAMAGPFGDPRSGQRGQTGRFLPEMPQPGHTTALRSPRALPWPCRERRAVLVCHEHKEGCLVPGAESLGKQGRRESLQVSGFASRVLAQVPYEVVPQIRDIGFGKPKLHPLSHEVFALPGVATLDVHDIVAHADHGPGVPATAARFQYQAGLVHEFFR